MSLIDTADARWTQDERIGFYLRDIVAIDPETGAELYASYGRRKSGRGTRYTCMLPTGEMLILYPTTRRPERRKAFTVTATSAAQAIERANKALTRFLSKSPRWSADEWNWVFAKA